MRHWYQDRDFPEIKAESDGPAEILAIVEQKEQRWRLIDEHNIAVQKLWNAEQERDTLKAENEALKAKMGQKDEGMHPNWYSEDSGGTVYSKAHGDSEVTCRSCKRTFLTDPMDAACRLCGNWFSAKRAAQKEGGK